MKKVLTNILILLVCTISVFAISGCKSNKMTYKPESQSLEGTWVWTVDNDREMEFTKDKIRFNYYVFSYELEGNVIHFLETHPSKSFRGVMEYSFDGDNLVIDLKDMDGFFYGQNGTVRLERPKSIVR